MLTQLTHDIATMSRRRALAATAGLVLGLAAFSPAKAADDTIKVGVLHSLSGTMAISETTLKDTILFLIDEQNKKGGVLGKKLEAVVVDPASNWPLFAEKARELITKDKVAVVFGCWTSVSRKSVLPVFKELNNILFYPVQYEGEESERNVFYTGAAPNQQAIPAVDYLMKDEKVKRWVLAGTDYVYPRTTNKILEAYLKSKGVAQDDIMINYTPFGHSDWQTIVADIKKFGSAGKKTAVVSTINGDANVPFYKELGNQGIKATDIPVVAFSVGEEELAGLDTKPLVGHLAAWNYFESIKTPANEKFIKEWQAYTKNPKRTTNDPMEAHVIGFNMWVKAVEKVKSTDADKVIDALPGTEAPNLTGGISKMLPNHHITKPVFIGEIKGAAFSPAKAADDTIKVGVLHSLSGTMAISETTLKDTILFLIDEQNKKGGVLGKKLEAVVVDPASNWPLFAEKARELITKDKVAVVFGCWTSVSRKSVLPVFKELNSILFYPVQYEGEESERNVFYTGAAPNQQAIPAVDYLMKDEKVKRWVLAGTDYVYPRTTNKILEAYLKSKGVAQDDIMINYTPFGHSDWQTIVADIKKFGSAGKKTAVVSTINGDANVPFYKELGNQGIKATDIPVVAFSVGEEELAGLDTKPLVGHLAAWNYFESIKTPANEKFIKDWQAYTKNPKRTTNDPMEAHVIGFNMWVKAVEKVKSTDADKVIDALPGTEAPNLTGGISKMLPNHHITKPVFIGEIKGDGQFAVVYKTKDLVPGDAWSKELEGSKDLIGDWVGKKCGNYNVKTNKCGGQAS